jgi:hypothetical protein
MLSILKNQCWTYVQLPNLPSLPLEFVRYIESGGHKQQESFFFSRKNRSVTRLDGTCAPNVDYDRWTVPKNIIEWITANVCSEFSNIGISQASPYGNSNSLMPHTDSTRDVALIWNSESGGDAVDTVFWKEYCQPMVRNNAYPLDYSTIEEIDRVRFPGQQWVMLHSHVIHSVENLTSPRIGLHIGLTYDQLKTIFYTTDQKY